MFKRIIAFIMVLVIIFSLVLAVPASAIFGMPGLDFIQAVVTELGDILFGPDSMGVSEYYEWVASGDSLTGECPERADGGPHIFQGDITFGLLVGRFTERCLYCGITATEFQRELEIAKLANMETPLVTHLKANEVSYNGVTLPNIEAVWDKDNYPYVYIREHSTRYDVTFLTTSFYVDATGDTMYWSDDGEGIIYSASIDLDADSREVGDWEFSREFTYSANGWNSGPTVLPIVWCNFDLYTISSNDDGDIVRDLYEDYDAPIVIVEPEVSRPSSFTQYIDNYNINNVVDEGSKTVNYYITPTEYIENRIETTVETTYCYDITVYDERTKVFTEPTSGAQILTSGWTYNYNTRSYDITVADGAFIMDDVAVTRIVVTYGDEAVVLDYYDENDVMLNSDSYTYVVVSDDVTFSSIVYVNNGGNNTGGGTDDSDDDVDTGIFKKLGQLISSLLTGIIDMIETALSGVLDSLIFLTKLVGEKLSHVVDTVMSMFEKIPKLFGGFLDFLSAVFPFIPEDIVTVITFGVVAVVLVGLLKMLIKR